MKIRVQAISLAVALYHSIYKYNTGFRLFLLNQFMLKDEHTDGRTSNRDARTRLNKGEKSEKDTSDSDWEFGIEEEGGEKPGIWKRILFTFGLNFAQGEDILFLLESLKLEKDREREEKEAALLGERALSFFSF